MQHPIRYKMYKDGKMWVFAGLVAFGITAGVSTNTTRVSADVVNDTGLMANTYDGVGKSKSTLPENSQEATATTKAVSIDTVGKPSSEGLTSAESNENVQNSTTEKVDTNSTDLGVSPSRTSSNTSDIPADVSEKSDISSKSVTSGAFTENVKSSSTEITNTNPDDVNAKTATASPTLANESTNVGILESQYKPESPEIEPTDTDSKTPTVDSASNVNPSVASSTTNASTNRSAFRAANFAVTSAENNIATVFDPKYPSGMWIDPDTKHYSFQYMLNQDKSRQLVLSTDRNGTGVVYAYLIDNSTKNVLEHQTIQQNLSVKLSTGMTIFNDNYAGVIWPSTGKTWSVEYSANGANPGTQFHKISFFVPELVEQTVSYVDQNDKPIIDSNGKVVEPIKQTGLTGQNYTTPTPTLVHGYYLVKPVNFKGVMSEFGVKGATYVRNYHDGYRVEYTEVDGEGLMNAKIYGPDNTVVRAINGLKKDQRISIQLSDRAITVQNPYVEQTRNVNYVYKKLGSLVPDVPGSTPVPYPNDTDPTKPGNPVIPNIPGYTPVDPSGQPLTPGDTYPVDPTKPGDDTPLHYEANDQKATVTYTDQTTGQTIKVDSVTGKSDKTSDYRTTATITDLANKGYELVSDNYPADGVVFDHDDQVDQSYEVVLQHKFTTVTPEQPGQPGEPIDPNNPDGPKYPNDTDQQALQHKINQTVNYVDEQGKTVAQPVTDQVTFERHATIDQVNGSVTYTDWAAKDNDDRFDEKISPLVPGYYASQPVVAAQTVGANDDDQVVNVSYKKLGSLVPDVPGSTPVPYPNDTDPTKPGDDTPLHYIKNVEDIPSDSDFDTHLTESTDVQSESMGVKPAITNGTTVVSLPETGESNNRSDSALVGTLVASLMSLFGLIGIAKKKKKTDDK